MACNTGAYHAAKMHGPVATMREPCHTKRTCLGYLSDSASPRKKHQYRRTARALLCLGEKIIFFPGLSFVFCAPENDVHSCSKPKDKLCTAPSLFRQYNTYLYYLRSTAIFYYPLHEQDDEMNSETLTYLFLFFLRLSPPVVAHHALTTLFINGGVTCLFCF